MKKESLYYVLGIFLILLIWELSSVIINNELIIPSLNSIFSELFSLLLKQSTYVSIFYSLSRTVIGFSLSSLLAVILSLSGEAFPFIKIMFSPLISILKSLPTAAIIIIFILLIGFSNAPYYIVLILAFPILYEGIRAGFDNIDQDLDEAVKIFGKTNQLYNLFVIKFPMCYPYISTAIITAFGLAFKAEIMSEVLIGSTTLSGIGFNLYYAKYYVNVNSLFSWTIIMATIVIIVDLLLKMLKSIISKKLFN